MITRIYIDNYLCFSNFEFRPERINLLIGPNGTGKSSFCEVIDKLVEFIVLGFPLKSTFPSRTMTRWDERTVQRFEIDVKLAGSSGDENDDDDEDESDKVLYHYEAEIQHDPAKEQVKLARERVTRGDQILFQYEEGTVRLFRSDGTAGPEFPFRGTRSYLSELNDWTVNVELMRFLEYFLVLRYLKLDPTSISPSTDRESAILDNNGENFASWYRHLHQEHSTLAPLFDDLSQALDGFSALRLPSSEGRIRKRDLLAVFTTGDPEDTHEIGFDELSDGQRALIILYCVLFDLRKSSTTLLLDEPENYVGLTEIQPWLAELGDALGDDGQVFVVSHHSEGIDFLAAEHPFLFERPGGGPVRVTPAKFDREKGLKASEQLARKQVSGD